MPVPCFVREDVCGRSARAHAPFFNLFYTSDVPAAVRCVTKSTHMRVAEAHAPFFNLFLLTTKNGEQAASGRCKGGRGVPRV
jgi:hypothetical protein